MFEHIPRLFALIHEILFLGIFAATLIRLTLAGMFAHNAWTNGSRTGAAIRVFAVGEAALAAALFVGAWTQGAAIIATGMLIVSLSRPTFRVWPRSTIALMLVMAITLIVTGPGAYAFDLPLQRMPGRNPLGAGLAFVLITFAIFIDFLQFVLDLLVIGIVLNWALDLIAIIAFSIMLHHHGGGVLKRRMPSLGVSSLIELVPILNALPTWTMFAVYTVVMGDPPLEEKKYAPPKKTRRSFGKNYRI